MSGDRAIDPLPLENFPSESDTQDPGFEQLFAQLVDIAGTPADGFDDDVAAASSILDLLDSALASLSGQDGGTLDDAFADALTIDPATAAEDVVNFSAALPGLQANVDNLGILLTGPPLPGPVPGGGGARPSTCGIFDFGKNPISVGGQANFVVAHIAFTNNLAQALTIKGITWTPAQSFGFQVIDNIVGAVVQPGAQLVFRISASNGDLSTTSATLTLNTDGPDPQPCLNVTAEWSPAVGAGGGSPITNCVKCADWACPPG